MKDHGFIFENPGTGRPYHDERSQRDTYWKPTLKRLGIRYRSPYHTRHTYATVAIIGDGNVTYVAKQMGNSPRVIYKHYATWIERADSGRQRAKMEGAFNSIVPVLSPESVFPGRRDWTRTSLPRKLKGSDGNGS